MSFSLNEILTRLQTVEAKLGDRNMLDEYGRRLSLSAWNEVRQNLKAERLVLLEKYRLLKKEHKVIYCSKCQNATNLIARLSSIISDIDDLSEDEENIVREAAYFVMQNRV